MSTSLAAQLRKLQAPQTSLLLQDKKRASLLFDPKEAANYDRQTIFELGIAGLDELKALNARFSEFESTLFDLSSQSFERAIQSKEVNQKLDNNIKKFFYLLSPYFLLKPSHKALEWLINRFHIHQYNVDDLLMLALPYHESRVFVRIVQLIDLSDPSSRWRWLQPLQKPGIPLSKSTLLNHASSSPGFLQLLSDSTIGAVKEHGHYAGVLSTLLAFYCTTLLGMLERCKKGATELQMTHILGALLRGLGSAVLDFAAACYMVVGRLVTTTALSTHVLHQLINRITKMNHPELQAEKAMLLVLIYQSQKRNLNDVPFQTMTRLSSRPDTASTLSQLAAGGLDVIPLLTPVLKEALKVIQTQSTGDTSDMRSLVENLMNEIRFKDNDAATIIKIIIEEHDVSILEDTKIKPIVAVGEANSSEEVTTWYAKILNRLERSYPAVFDAAVCGAIKGSDISTSRALSLKQMLGFELQLDLFDKLHHPKSSIRAEALRCLANQSSTLKEKDIVTLKDSLLNVLSDTSSEVVDAVLHFPNETLQRIIGVPSLRKALGNILLTHVPKDKADGWLHVLPRLVDTLTSLPKGNALEELEVLLTLLPHIMADVSTKIADIVIKSPFGLRSRFVRGIKSIGVKEGSTTSARKAVCVQICLPDSLDHHVVLELYEKLQNGDAPCCLLSKFSFLLLLAASVPENASTDVCLQSLEATLNIVKDEKLATSSERCAFTAKLMQPCIYKCLEGFMPLEGFLLVLEHIITRCKRQKPGNKQQKLNLQEMSPETRLKVQLYCCLSTGCAREKEISQSAYVSVLKSFFETFFPSPENQVGFLCHFWAGHMVEAKSKQHSEALTPATQMQALRLCSMLLAKPQTLEWALALQPNNSVVPALLVALRCPVGPVRRVAAEVVKILASCNMQRASFAPLFQQLSSRAEELIVDPDQLRLVLYTLFSSDKVVRSLLAPEVAAVMPQITNTLLDCITQEETPPYITASILDSLTSVNSQETLGKLLPLVTRVLNGAQKTKLLDVHSSMILCNIIGRIDTRIIESFATAPVWVALTKALADQQTVVIVDDKFTCPAVLACEQITRDLWEALPKNHQPLQQRLLSLIISTGSEAENPSVVSAVTHSIRQIFLDGALVVNELIKMRDANVAPPATALTKRRSVVNTPSPHILQTKEWRCGLTLLELLQNKKKLGNVHLMLPVLFEILKKCLYFEEQAPVEYAKQLLLSCILHCCQKLSPDGDPVPSDILPTQVLDIEAVVHCVRGTQNPQTHHHALLLLAHMAAMVPEQVLYNIMAIFTFMGSHVLRQDDAYSFQVISKIVDTIIPILIKASLSGTLPGHNALKLEETVASVMRVFADAVLDIPEHRRLSLFHKLLTTLDAKQYLWLFLCLILESHTVHHSDVTNEGKRSRTSNSDSEAPKRLEVALQLITKFPPDVVLTNCVRLVQHVRSLPMEKGEDQRKRAPIPAEVARFRVKTLFDVELHTPKELRHYKYTIVTFLSALLSSLPFVNQVACLSEEAISELEPVYSEMLQVLLAFVQVVAKQSDISLGTPTAKYWRVMTAQSHDVLDKVNALLPSKLFLTVVAGLMAHELPSLRRKAMELLNSRLSSSQRDLFFESCASEDLLGLLQPLLNVLDTIKTAKHVDEPMEDEKGGKVNDEQLLNQQTALLSIKYLAKHLAFDHHVKFKPILEHLTKLIGSGGLSNSNLLASVVLCAAELCSSLRAHAISTLPTLMPALVRLLSIQTANAPDVVQISLAAATYRVVESLSAFLSPYLHPLLVEVCLLSAHCAAEIDDQGKPSHVAAKLKSTRQKLASSVPARVLVPAVENAYKQLVVEGRLNGVGPLMDILSDSFTGLIASDLSAMQASLTEFFLSALQFRSSCNNSVINKVLEKDINEVEGHVVDALVSLVLKMSESSFRILYYKLYEWSTRMEEFKERTITFYRLSCGISESLKGLFVLFAGHFIKNAAALLDHCNVMKVGEPETDELPSVEAKKERPEELFFGTGPEAEQKCLSLVNHILKTLHNVFLYDSQNYLTKERFEVLMQPIVDQLENPLGGEKSLRKLTEDIVVPCVAQLAAACTDDTLWKQLNYQILLKTRHQLPVVRLASLEALCAMARKLGEGFLPLLPETVPFLAELLEDEEESIETACRRAVQDLEQVLGEPIQKYF